MNIKKLNPRDLYYMWGGFQLTLAILLIAVITLFFVEIYVDNSKPGDYAYPADLWLEQVWGAFQVSATARQNHAIAVARERLEEFLTIDPKNREALLLSIHELDKSLVAVINNLDPSSTKEIAILQVQRKRIEELIGIIQGVQPEVAIAAEETPISSNEGDLSPTSIPVIPTQAPSNPEPIEKLILDFGTGVIQSLDQPDESPATNTVAVVPTNTPIPEPTKPILLPSATPTPIPPTAVPTQVPSSPTPIPTQALGNGQEIEFTAQLTQSNGVYYMTRQGTTYTILNGSNYSQYVGQTVHVHGRLYSDNRIILNEVEND